MNKFPYPQHCALTCFQLREKLTHPIAAIERSAIMFILETRMRRAAFEG